MRRVLTAGTMLLALACAAPATAAQKAIWGPVDQFERYERLGVDVFLFQLQWSAVVPEPGVAPAWPAELDTALADARRRGMRVAVRVTGSPAWANGGRAPHFAPEDPRDLARFAADASRRFPGVSTWIVWEETTRRSAFRPLDPRRYARMLDAAYASLKAVDPRDRVAGGNSFTTGDISPRDFIRRLRLPSGRPPRMDLYTHNAFSGRRPDIRKGPLGKGRADLSDLDTLAGWVDRWLPRRRGQRIPLFVTEFTLPTDGPNELFNFWVSRRTQADWLGAALRLVKRYRRVHAFGWYALQDTEQANIGLLTADGRRKPAYDVFRRG